HRRRFEESFRLLMVGEQDLELKPQALVPRTGFVEVGCPAALLDIKDRVKDPVDLPPAFSLHRLYPLSSLWSQAFASFQSRITVSGETFNTSAVSFTLKPPKNRSSTTWLLRSSTVARRSSASSIASKSRRVSGDTTTDMSNEIRSVPP